MACVVCGGVERDGASPARHARWTKPHYCGRHSIKRDVIVLPEESWIFSFLLSSIDTPLTAVTMESSDLVEEFEDVLVNGGRWAAADAR